MSWHKRQEVPLQLQPCLTLLLLCRDDLEQARILADQVQRREKLRKRALISWQQNMRLLAARASALDKQKASHTASSPSKGHTLSIEKALSSFDELAESEEEMRAKFEHDMALSLQLTQGVAEEAGKLQHVKIVRANPGQPQLGSDAASAPVGLGLGHVANDHAATEVQAEQSEASQHADAPDSTAQQQQVPGNVLLQSPSRTTRSTLASPCWHWKVPLAMAQQPRLLHQLQQACSISLLNPHCTLLRLG